MTNGYKQVPCPPDCELCKIGATHVSVDKTNLSEQDIKDRAEQADEELLGHLTKRLEAEEKNTRREAEVRALKIALDNTVTRKPQFRRAGTRRARPAAGISGIRGGVFS